MTVQLAGGLAQRSRGGEHLVLDGGEQLRVVDTAGRLDDSVDMLLAQLAATMKPPRLGQQPPQPPRVVDAPLRRTDRFA